MVRGLSYSFSRYSYSESIRSKIDNFLNSSELVTSDNINLASAELASIFKEAGDMSLKKRGKQNKNKNKHKNWFDSDLKQLRFNLINYGKVYSKYPNDPLVKKHFYKLYREYNKCRKAKKKLYKSKLLHELETA